MEFLHLNRHSLALAAVVLAVICVFSLTVSAEAQCLPTDLACMTMP